VHSLNWINWGQPLLGLNEPHVFVAMEIQKNITLAPYTTFKIGGPADYFCEVKSLEDLEEALIQAKKKSWKIFILGGGSNLLINDKGFKGLVIKMNWDFIKNIGDGLYEVGAGTLLAKLLAETVKNNLTGIEWAIGIPGTLGGAICGNSGAYGQATAESVVSVKALDLKTLKVKNFKLKDCKFQYRNSIFKDNNQYIIISAQLQFYKGEGDKVKEVLQKYATERKNKIPPYPSAGCVFKNISMDDMTYEFMNKIPPEKTKGGKIPVGYLIEQCGLKGKRIKGAEISSQHANFIVNFNKATFLDVIELIALAKNEVKNQFNVNLEEEIRYLGF
jgi:UDP-N-acetylmuramate dehydrogenase